MAERINVGLVGASGYTGMELLRLVEAHPAFRLAMATSRQEKGRRLQDVFPQFYGRELGGLEISEPEVERIAACCDLVFLAIPHGSAMSMAYELLQRRVKVVDFSADFRLQSAEIYAQWYGLEHKHPELLSRAAYGLVDLYAESIRQAELVANPGCYPTSVILGLYPALAGGLVDPASLIVDSKSGASGAGRTPKTGTLFCEIQDTFRPYSLGLHRHTPEIEQELAKIAGRELTVSFNPHLLPIDRGILSTIYARPRPGLEPEALRRAFAEHYEGKRWIRLLPEGMLPETRHVRGTMFCDVGLVSDPRTGQLIIVSAIDNLCRGASGQAVANANLMLGLEVSLGLDQAPLVP